MPFRSLGEFLGDLERAGDLVRVPRRVSRDLEMTEVVRRTIAAGGPALLFEEVEPKGFPVAMNVLGAPRRIARALGDADVEATADRVARLARLRPPAGVLGALRDLPGTLETLETLRSLGPRRVSRAPCQEIAWDRVDLDRLPILKTWPGDAGRTITFPVVVTSDPETGQPHTGVYRLQQYGPDTLGFHAQLHRIGAANHRKWSARGERMPVAAVLGADPATLLAGLSPVPEGLPNWAFAGFLRGEALEMVRAATIDLEVPAEAEIVLEGYVDPSERHVEGPFGDHTGYYSAPEPFPVLHVTHVTQRAGAVYLTTVTGRPPTEDSVLGQAVERIFRPVVRLVLPEIVDMHLPEAGLFINVLVVSVRKQFPGHPRKVMHALWGLGQLMFTRYVVIVDHDVDVHDLSEVLYRVGLQADPSEDLELVEGPVDQLSISNRRPNIGGKLGIDATRKGPADGYDRGWPREIAMDPEVSRTVDGWFASDPTFRRLLGRP